jgi:galactose mutarotase-like enzyme
VVELEAGDAAAWISPVDGGRVARLTVRDFDVLVTGDSSDDSIRWGSYPMVPWAGRLRHGRFEHHVAPDRTTTIQMPLDMPPHAIHGTGYTDPRRAGVRVDRGGRSRGDAGDHRLAPMVRQADH